MDLNEYSSIQDGITVIVVLIFYDPLNLLLSEDSCKEREFGTETHVLSVCKFVLVIFGVNLTHGKQTPKGFHSDA